MNLQLKPQIEWLINKMALRYQPVAVYMDAKQPEGSLSIKNKGQGCIASLIFTAAKGKTVYIDKDSTGLPCSAYYLGYTDWIFPGIEKFLSHGDLGNGRECERFVQSPELAKGFVESFHAEEQTTSGYIFQPIGDVPEAVEPEVVVFYGNADQMSALVFLIHFQHPQTYDRIATGFAASCMAVSTIPLQFARNNQDKAFWGMHDIAFRTKMPAELMTMAMPYKMFVEICSVAAESFLLTENWSKLQQRIIDSGK